jgi:ABC-type Zn2+ transport system substrate-binding protein/surface adhesin
LRAIFILVLAFGFKTTANSGTGLAYLEVLIRMEGKELVMSEIIKTPTQSVQTPQEQADQGHTHTKTAKKDDHAHHRHHRHEHAYISPASTGTSHLNPGSISIGRR